MVVGEIANSTSISFEKIIVLEIAARKLDFSPVGKESPCPEGVLQYFHTYVGLGHFLGFKILNFNILGVFRKLNMFLDMKILWILFGGHHKFRLYSGVISMHLRVFSLSQSTEWGIFIWVAKISNNFWGCLKFLIFLGMKGRCWAGANVWRKNESTPPPPPLGVPAAGEQQRHRSDCDDVKTSVFVC